MRGRSSRTLPRAVHFDLGGTLVNELDFNELADAALSVGLVVEPEALHEGFRQVEEEYDRSWGRMPLPEYWGEVFRRGSGAAVAPEKVAAILDRLRGRPDRHELFSDVVRCLDALASGRYRMGVISNSRSEGRVREILQRTGILDRFATVVSSGTEEVAKPEAEIFRRAAERIGVPPADSVYVGNLANVDARAATRAGLHGVWLNRHGTGLGDDPPEITSLTELPSLVQQLLSAPVK